MGWCGESAGSGVVDSVSVRRDPIGHVTLHHGHPCPSFWLGPEFRRLAVTFLRRRANEGEGIGRGCGHAGC